MIRLERATTAVPSPHADAAPRVVLRDLDLAFGPGEIHRILGANGSGKSTLLRTLAGLRAPASGRLRIDGKEISRTGCSEGDRATLWPRVAILFEEPDPQFLTESVEAEIAFGLESLALPPAEIRERTRDALHANGLAGFRRRDPLTLSGGEKARVLLAAVLAARPGALLLDQALAHLDRGTRREIEDELAREAATRGLLVVHARQDLDPLHPGERAHEIRDERLVTLDAAFDPAAAGAGWTRSESRREAAPGTAVLSLDQVAWRPPGASDDVVRSATLEAREGETVALIGRSGSGKTTLLKLAAGLLQPSSGSRRMPGAGAPAGKGPARAARLALEYPERQLFGRTVGEDVAALLWVEGMPESERRALARTAMESMGLDPARFEERSPITLSEGEKRRAALAGLLVDPPRAILLDEPTAGLDLQGRLALAKALAEVRARGHAVILASHDLEFVANTADRVMLLGGSGGSSGSVLASGTPDAILSDPALMSRGGLPALASRGTPPHPSGADARAAFQRA